MRQKLRSVGLGLFTKSLHYLETRFSRDPQRHGGIQRLLERTWYDPEVRPFSIESVEGFIAKHGFKSVAVMVCGLDSDATVKRFLRDCPWMNPRFVTFNRTVRLFDGLKVESFSVAMIADVDAVVVLDPEPEEYLNVLRYSYEHGVSCPVVTDFTRLPWVGGQAPFFSGGLESKVYVHNHFAEVFGIKDPIQFYYEICDGAEVKAQGFRLLGPNETIRFSSQELGLGSVRNGVFRHIAHHPGFAKIPHRRFRAVVDIANARSQCEHHGLELEREMGPNYAAKGGAIDPVVLRLGPQSDVLLTAMRSNSPSSSDVPLQVSLVGKVQGDELGRSAITITPAQRSVTVSVKELLAPSWSEDRNVRVLASISGPCDRLCWTTVEKIGEREVLTGNHGIHAPKEGEHLLLRAEAASAYRKGAVNERVLAEIAAMRAKGVILRPYPIPIFPPEDRLLTSFTFASSVPPLEHFEIATLDSCGCLLDRQEVRLRFGSQPFLDAHQYVPQSLRESGGLMLVAPVYERENLAPDRCAVVGHLRIRDSRSGDYDYTELMDCWRNIPGYFPRYPSNAFSGRSRVRKSRTSLMIRAVHDGDCFSHLCLILASGDLSFMKRDAPVELKYFRPDGRSLIAHVLMSAWTIRYVKVEDVFPTLAEFSPDGYGWIRVMSNCVDLNAVSISRRTKVNSVAIQHLWGQ